MHFCNAIMYFYGPFKQFFFTSKTSKIIMQVP